MGLPDSAARHASNGGAPTSFNWRLYLLKDRGTSKVNPRSVASGFRGFEHSAPHLPIGGDLRYRRADGQLYIHATGRFEVLSIHLSLQGRDTKGFYKPFPHDWTNDIRLAERFSRILMARAAGIRLGAASTRSLAGYSAAAAVCSKTSRVFVDIGQWAAAKGWSITRNDELAYLTLTKGSNYIVLPLGAGKMKVNGVWRTLPDLVAEKDGRQFIVETEISNAL